MLAIGQGRPLGIPSKRNVELLHCCPVHLESNKAISPPTKEAVAGPSLGYMANTGKAAKASPACRYLPMRLGLEHIGHLQSMSPHIHWERQSAPRCLAKGLAPPMVKQKASVEYFLSFIYLTRQAVLSWDVDSAKEGAGRGSTRRADPMFSKQERETTEFLYQRHSKFRVLEWGHLPTSP